MNLTVDLDALWTPKPTQARFIDAITQEAAKASLADKGIPAYIGAYGSGKSWAICRAAIGLSLAYPGIRGLVGRYNYTDLRNTTLIEFFSLIQVIEESVRNRLPPNRRHEFLGVGTFRKDTGDYTWFNGAVTRFTHLEKGYDRFKSEILGYWGIDEASEVEADRPEPPTVLTLMGRLRQVGMPCVGFMVSNPTGFDHWLYKWYGIPERAGVGPKGWPVFRTSTVENAANLPPGYEEGLRNRYGDAWTKRYVEGEWGAIDDGAPIFPTFDRTIHVRPVEWLRRQPVYVGIDLGTGAPGVIWGQMDPGPGKGFQVLKSWGPKNLDIYKLAAGIKARNDQWFPGGRFKYYCGHDGNARKDTNPKSSAEVLADYGMRPTVRFTVHERGFTTIRSLLEVRDNARPGLVIDPCNRVLIEAFEGGYRYDPKKEDTPLKTDHYDPYVDALRYVLVNLYTMGGTLPATAPVPAFRGLGPRR